MHRFEMSVDAGDDRERYLRKMSDRLHDRFLEKPAFLDLDFIRAEIKKLDSQIDDFLKSGLTWERVRTRLGDPSEYADAIFASRLLSPSVNSSGSRPGILVTVLKILFIVAPVNFLVAIGPLLIGFLILVVGWVVSAVILIAPVMALVHFAWQSVKGIGIADVALLIGVFAFGQILALAMMALSRSLFRAVWAWLSWNIAFLRAEPRK